MSEKMVAVVKALEAYAESIHADDIEGGGRAEQVGLELADTVSTCFNNCVLWQMEVHLRHYRELMEADRKEREKQNKRRPATR
jgi:hypothetical protein